MNISKVVATDVALADHFCVFCENVISVKTNVQTEVITKQYIRENTSEIYSKALSRTPTLSWASINELVDNFKSKTTNGIDAIATITVKVVSGKK